MSWCADFEFRVMWHSPSCRKRAGGHSLRHHITAAQCINSRLEPAGRGGGHTELGGQPAHLHHRRCASKEMGLRSIRSIRSIISLVPAHLHAFQKDRLLGPNPSGLDPCLPSTFHCIFTAFPGVSPPKLAAFP